MSYLVQTMVEVGVLPAIIMRVSEALAAREQDFVTVHGFWGLAVGTDALMRTWEQVGCNVDRYAAGLRADEIRIEKFHTSAQ